MLVNIVFESGFNFGFDVDGSVNYSSLVTKVEELFPQIQIESLQWRDEDGDLITFSSQEELNEAIKVGTDDLNVYVEELQSTVNNMEDTPQDTTDHKFPRKHHSNRKERQKRMIGEEIPPDMLSDFFSVSKVPRKIKRRFRRCGRKRLLRHRVPSAADCYTHSKSFGRRHQNELNKTLASMSISEDGQKS